MLPLFTSLEAVAAFGLSGGELALIVFVVVLLFGASKLPQLGKSFGEGLKNFKRGIRDAEKEDEDEEEARRAPRALPDDSKRATDSSASPAKKGEVV
jgi:sec-independent protein translocase protein TatA